MSSLIRRRARVLFVVVLATSLSSAEINDQNDSRIKLNILSRPVRLMREGKIPSLVFTLDNNSYIIDETNGRTISDGNRLTVTASREGFLAVLGSLLLKDTFKLKIMSRMKEGVVSLSVENNVRKYPLPMAVECGKGMFHVYTWTPIQRYCVDSAIAEYGSISPSNREAVYSLAHLIRARAEFNKKKPRHKDADFCDLTHCQVYRGIMTGGGLLADSWRADISACRDTIHFHASCGGETFGRGIFGDSGRKESCDAGGVRDWLYRDGTRLCSAPRFAWTRELARDDLCSIVFKNEAGRERRDMTVMYDRQSRKVTVRSDNESVSFFPETFRLKVNRIKGWNFIKSNNYSVSESDKSGKKVFIFQGRGNGHGAGLCQEGAVNLARMGYGRYEILEHYYPDIPLRDRGNGGQPDPYLSYCIFDLSTGAVVEASPGDRLLLRRIPPGSIFKLFVALYLAAERRDIFNDYNYTCVGKNAHDGVMPDRCWNKNGHGTLGIRGALANSCNLYFASLYGRISYKKFKKFFSDFCRCNDIQAALPEVANERQWSKMLAGLDFRADFRVKDYMRLAQMLHLNSMRMQRSGCNALPDKEKTVLFQALCSTFTEGTASGKIKPYGSPINYSELESWVKKSEQFDLPGEMWGKTATVLDGTNRPVSYGLFVGGCGERGIVALLRKGNGSLSARWARVVMRLHFGSR